MKTIKIISVIMYSSLQFIINIIKGPRSYPKGHLSRFYAKQFANRTGFCVLTQLAMASGNPRLASNLGLARYGWWKCSPREL